MKIGFFGCSFTEGGGFNSPVYVDYAIKNNIIDISELDDKVKIWGNTEREAYETYGKDYNGPFNSISKKYCYPTMVGKKLNCEVVNFAEGCASNEYTFKKLYENYQDFDICVAQFTLYSRRYQWNEGEEKFEHFNKIDNYTLNHYNEEYTKDKVSMMIDLFDNLNKKIYWIFHEPIPKSCKSKNVIKFEPSGHLHDFIHLNKATFRFETNGNYIDDHFSMKGNDLISDKIVERIKCYM